MWAHVSHFFPVYSSYSDTSPISCYRRGQSLVVALVVVGQPLVWVDQKVVEVLVLVNTVVVEVGVVGCMLVVGGTVWGVEVSLEWYSWVQHVLVLHAVL